VLGADDRPDWDDHAIASQYRLRTRFPAAVEKEAASFGEPGARERAGREDLRDQLVLTIDPEDAQDHDDALSVRDVGEGRHEVGIHIADVSHYVRDGSALEAEALERGTSTYLPSGAIPMLPSRLSSDLCSLRPDRDRLALSVFVTIDAQGRRTDVRFAETVIRSRHRLHYAQVQANGTLGAWGTTTALPQAMISHTAFASNGYLYVVGGNVGPTCVTTVRYAPINANGTIGAWTTTSALPQARCGIVSAGAVNNGYLYVAAGFNNSDITNRIYYAQINANGSLGAWQTNATNLTNSREYLYAEAAGGSLYVIGGQGGISGNVLSSVERATINANGSLGAFTAAPSLPAGRGYLGGARSGNTIYTLGGGTQSSGGTPQSSVYYAQVGD